MSSYLGGVSITLNQHEVGDFNNGRVDRNYKMKKKYQRVEGIWELGNKRSLKI